MDLAAGTALAESLQQQAAVEEEWLWMSNP
jgi:hypothetical protein